MKRREEMWRGGRLQAGFFRFLGKWQVPVSPLLGQTELNNFGRGSSVTLPKWEVCVCCSRRPCRSVGYYEHLHGKRGGGDCGDLIRSGPY